MDGVHAKRFGDVERVLEKDLRSLVALALGFDRGGKKESEKIVSAWRRYVDVSISMVELTCESAVGKGRDSRCNGSEDEGAWRVHSGCMGGAGRGVANCYGHFSFSSPLSSYLLILSLDLIHSQVPDRFMDYY